MKYDQTAMSYGLFQVVFAHMTYELARALFELRKRSDKQFTWKQIPWPFKEQVKQFKKELDALEQECEQKDSLAEVRRLLKIAERLAPWRNDRVHAIAGQVDHKLVLFDWKTGKRLSISADECDRMIADAVQVITTLPTHISEI